MSKIKIKYFGPIKEGLLENDGWMDIKKVTVFIGNQGSGKSTIAKLISTCTWIEKALTRGDYNIKWFERKNKLRNQYLNYHRLENYFSNYDNLSGNTLIDYKGDSYHIKYEDGTMSVTESKNGDYPLPQVMYVPAERNFISNVKTPKALKLISDSLIEFVTEFDNAKDDIKGQLKLPVNDADLEYNRQNDTVYLRGKDYRIKLNEASSGFQSLVPLYLVSRFLANSVKKQSENSKELMTSEQRDRFRKQVKMISDNKDLTDEQKRIAISEEAKSFNKTAFINIVEEPEQNLYPSSQRQILNSLLEFNNINSGNKLIITTHSPYIINFLTLAVKAFYLLNRVTKDEQRQRIEKVVPVNSVVDPMDLVIFELDERNGSVNKLKNYEGIPSDKNYLNKSLGDGNLLYDSLLEIEEEL